jgi:hypothetical protein
MILLLPNCCNYHRKFKGEDIGILTPKWAQEWGIGGTEKNDNGVLILLAKAERKYGSHQVTVLKIV